MRIRRRPIVLAPMLGLLAALVPLAGATADDEPSLQPWPRTAVSAPLELARLVAARGDDAVLARLEDSAPRRIRREAIAAAPFLRDPERALLPLSELAAGSDPDLAPPATLALHRIATSLEHDSMEAREVDIEALAPARANATLLAEDETARPDLRNLAAFSADALAAVGVP